jgi:hypothetical protein
VLFIVAELASAPPAVSVSIDRGVAVLRGDQQRRVAADARRRLHVGPRVEQRPGEIDVALLRGPVQRGHAVALRRVDVGALLQEGPHRVLVALHRRVDERRRRSRVEQRAETQRADRGRGD